MTSIRKNYTAKFKRDVALALIRKDATIYQAPRTSIANKTHRIYPLKTMEFR